MESLLKTEVLDQGYVELLDMMPSMGSADMAVVTAARVSYLGKSKGEDADKKLLWYLLKHRHSTPLETVQFKFRIRAPVITWWQLVRHRMQSISLQSGRYTPFEEDCFYMPKEIRGQSSSNKQASEGVIDATYNAVILDALEQHYKDSFDLYSNILKAGGAKELARLALPGFAVYYTGITSMNAHNLIHFLRLRLANEAQYEIRVYARAMYDMLKVQMPWTCEYLEIKEGSPWI